MGQKHSKDRLLYEYVVNADISGIQFLSKQGASLEWKDKEGKTPLIVASKDAGLYEIAQILVELGANVDAFCKGNHGGTPLHYAAKEGLDRTVTLLLSHGANAFVKNNKNRTPLDIARQNGRNLIVRDIEGRICYFSGQIRETFGPGFSDASANQMSTRVIWVVVVPRSLHKPPKRPELELVVYSTPQDAEPRRIVLLRGCKIKEPRFDQPSPALIIFDKRTNIRYKFSPISYTDKQQLRRLYNACKGISQVKTVSAQTSIEQWDYNTINSPITTTPWRTPNRLSPPMTPTNNTLIHETPRVITRNYTVQNHTEPIVPSAPPVEVATQASANNVRPETAPSSCVVCWEVAVEAACVPCGHVSTCLSCLHEIKNKNGVCPVCRAHIDQVMKLYGI